MLPANLLVCPDWIDLPPAARVIFIDLCKRHNGENNGSIGYGCAAGAGAAQSSPATAGRMINLLQDVGLLKLRQEGAFNIKDRKRQAREWEIVIFPAPGRPLTRCWSQGTRVLHLNHWLVNSAAYIGLLNRAKCILVELMRRFDGGNNGSISFGGEDGAHAGLGRDTTERALTELERANFIVETAPEVPYLERPRKWRLTMYKADGKAASKDFMRAKPTPAPTLENSFHGLTGADDTPPNVSLMRMSISPNSPPSAALPRTSKEILNANNVLSAGGPVPYIRSSETFKAPDIRSHDMHLEASPTAVGRRAGLAPIAPRSDHPHTPPTSPPEATREFGGLEISAETLLEEPAGIFEGGLPLTPSPMDYLRVELRAVLSRRRGTQSRLAEAVGISRSAFANALSGRERFATTAAAALRRWLDGQPVTGVWPPLPPATEKQDAA